jgi:hypothetical protein
MRTVFPNLVLTSLFFGSVWSHSIPLLDTTSSETLTVGFALTVDDAAAVVRYNNGSFQDLVRLEASDVYLQLMRRLSSQSSQHPR